MKPTATGRHKPRWMRNAGWAILSGMIVFLVLEYAAWNKLRNANAKQAETRRTLKELQDFLTQYQTEFGSFPETFDQLIANSGMEGVTESYFIDGWENPIQYAVVKDSYELVSLGRDGQPGGIGLDADLYHDGRDRQRSAATIPQFFRERHEPSGLAVLNGGLIAGGVVAIWMFVSLNGLGRRKLPWQPWQVVLYALAIVGIAVWIGFCLIPLHIPSGH